VDQDGGWNGADQVPRPRARGLDVSIQGRSLQPHPTAWTADDRMSLSDERPKAGQATPGHREIRCIRPKKPETPDFAQETRAQYSFFSSLLVL
jgi:hypothetical protein